MNSEGDTGEGPSEPSSADHSLPELIAEAGIAAATGLPPQIQKSFWKVVGRIFVASAEWPAKYLEGRGKIATARAAVEAAKYEAEAADIKSQQKARDLINRSSAKVAAEKFSAPELADRAVDFHAAHILREQQNRESVLKFAADDLLKEPPKVDSTTEIEDDWLFAFLKEASTRTDDDYRRAFGKILAGEIRSPNTFSIASIQALSRLDKVTADTFQKLCCICIKLGSNVRIISEDFATIGSNKLEDLGLSYNDVSRLVDHGLLRGEYNEQIEIPAENIKNPVLIHYTNTLIRIHRKKPYDGVENLLPLPLKGPSLTSMGQELYNIVDTTPSEAYLRKLSTWLDSRGYYLDIMLGATKNDSFRNIPPE